jgi:hypothetical protein
MSSRDLQHHNLLASSVKVCGLISFVIFSTRELALLHRLLLDRGSLATLATHPKKWVDERVGTVHTFQRREAEAVIFVLGAPEAEQSAPPRLGRRSA